MKEAAILLMIFMASCATPESQTKELKPSHHMDSMFTVHQNDTINTTPIISDRREYVDSAHFHIIRGWYTSGALYFEDYENRENNLDLWKVFYENGRLKQKGNMTNGNHIYIGKWEYYSAEGDLDSVINYDLKQTISYSQAIKIAAKHNYAQPDVDISQVNHEGTMYWQLNEWPTSENSNVREARTILIHSETGKVTIPDYKVFSTH